MDTHRQIFMPHFHLLELLSLVFRIGAAACLVPCLKVPAGQKPAAVIAAHRRSPVIRSNLFHGVLRAIVCGLRYFLISHVYFSLHLSDGQPVKYSKVRYARLAWPARVLPPV